MFCYVKHSDQVGQNCQLKCVHLVARGLLFYDSPCNKVFLVGSVKKNLHTVTKFSSYITGINIHTMHFICFDLSQTKVEIYLKESTVIY